MGVWVPTNLQAIAVRVDPRAALPYMAMVTLEDHHWVWRPTDHHWVWRPTYHHWVWTPTDHLWVWRPTDPRAIAHSGSMFYTDTRGRTKSPQGALGRQDQFTDYAIPRGEFHSVENMQGEDKWGSRGRDADLTKFLNSVAMVRRIHGDNLPGPTTRLQEAPIVR